MVGTRRAGAGAQEPSMVTTRRYDETRAFYIPLFRRRQKPKNDRILRSLFSILPPSPGSRFCKNRLFCVNTKPVCPSSGERASPIRRLSLFPSAAEQRYNTLDLASKIVRQRGFAPLLETCAKEAKLSSCGTSRPRQKAILLRRQNCFFRRFVFPHILQKTENRYLQRLRKTKKRQGSASEDLQNPAVFI